jgi:hypothetical protein
MSDQIERTTQALRAFAHGPSASDNISDRIRAQRLEDMLFWLQRFAEEAATMDNSFGNDNTMIHVTLVDAPQTVRCSEDLWSATITHQNDATFYRVEIPSSQGRVRAVQAVIDLALAGALESAEQLLAANAMA